MKSYKIRKIKHSEVEIFFENNKRIYASNLKEFLGCSESHARYVIARIKKEKKIKSHSLKREDLKEYLDID